MRLKLVPSETTINFMRLRMPALGFSGVLVAASIALFTLVGLNLGIDSVSYTHLTLPTRCLV